MMSNVTRSTAEPVRLRDAAPTTVPCGRSMAATPDQRAPVALAHPAQQEVVAMETCKWYVSVEKEECGEPAVEKIKRLPGGKILPAPLPVCHTHKSRCDRIFAQMRAEGRKP